jgi:hypothetical protein
MVEEWNFAELAGKFACDHFRKRHEAGLRVGRHGEAALERARAVCSADPCAKHEGVAADEGDGWLLRGVPKVDECGLAEIGNSKEETRGTQFRQVRAARCLIPYVLYAV